MTNGYYELLTVARMYVSPTHLCLVRICNIECVVIKIRTWVYLYLARHQQYMVEKLQRLKHAALQKEIIDKEVI